MSAVLVKNEVKEEVFNFHQPKPYTFDDLPTELLLKVFENLSLQALASCSQVCKKWRATLGNYGDKLFLKFFKGETVKEKLQYQLHGQVQAQKVLTEANEKTQLLANQNTSANRRKLLLKIALVAVFVLFAAAAITLTVLTCGTAAVFYVAAGCLLMGVVGGSLMKQL